MDMMHRITDVLNHRYRELQLRRERELFVYRAADERPLLAGGGYARPQCACSPARLAQDEAYARQAIMLAFAWPRVCRSGQERETAVSEAALPAFSPGFRGGGARLGCVSGSQVTGPPAAAGAAAAATCATVERGVGRRGERLSRRRTAIPLLLVPVLRNETILAAGPQHDDHRAPRNRAAVSLFFCRCSLYYYVYHVIAPAYLASAATGRETPPAPRGSTPAPALSAPRRAAGCAAPP